MKKRVPVEELSYGVYVTELDRPWTETPFLFQGFQLKSEAQLATLRKYCKFVYVDTERSAVDVRMSHATAPQRAPAAPVDGSVRGTTPYPDAVSIEKEFPRARDIYAESLAIVEECLRSLQSGSVLDGRRVREAVSRITESIVRNPDALLLVSKLREKGGNVLNRALDVSVYMIVFARFLQLAREELELLGLVGLLQDVGKTKIPSEVLDKPDALSAKEVELVKSHVVKSVAILRATPGLPPDLPDLAAMHHERHDGTGYPRGLKGPEIGLHGSIAGIVDTFDALTKTRPYANQMSPSNALSFLYKERGVKYHAALVEQFIQCIGIFPVGSVVELNTGEIGIVISQNLVRRLKPRVMVVLDARGNPLNPHKILDLVREPKATSTEPYHIRRTLEQSRIKIDPREFFL